MEDNAPVTRTPPKAQESVPSAALRDDKDLGLQPGAPPASAFRPRYRRPGAPLRAGTIEFSEKLVTESSNAFLALAPVIHFINRAIH